MFKQALILTNFSVNYYQNYSDNAQIYEVNKEIFDFFEDGFSSPWIKFSMVLAHLVNLLSNGGLCFVVWYEVTGRAGPYRTLVNKLVSFLTIQVRTIFKFLLFLRSFFSNIDVKIVPTSPQKRSKLVYTNFQT